MKFPTKRRWYYNPPTYRAMDRYKVKLMENFLHWIKGEPQTDMNDQPIEPEPIVIRI